jgi:hypothetical protein
VIIENRSTAAKPLLILEGPDCAGKSTLLHNLLEAPLGRRVLGMHLGSFKHITDERLCCIYMDAMMPALQGLAPVVMDRSWISEPYYHAVYRPNSALRVPSVYARMLQRVALRCKPWIVYCRPDRSRMVEEFRRRLAGGSEMLDDEAQWSRVVAFYDEGYAKNCWGLRTKTYKFDEPEQDTFDLLVEYLQTSDLGSAFGPTQMAGWRTAGNMEARVLVVGESFANHRPHDHLVQYPFVSFWRQGCSAYLTDVLEQHKIPERDLFWGNQDCPKMSEWFRAWLACCPSSPRRIICLGNTAHDKVSTMLAAIAKLKHKKNLREAKSKTTVFKLPHPAHHMRFSDGEYPFAEAFFTNK